MLLHTLLGYYLPKYSIGRRVLGLYAKEHGDTDGK